MNELNQKNTSQFRLRVDPVSKRLYKNKNVLFALNGKSLIFNDSKKIDLDADVLDMMTNYKLNAMIIKQSKHKTLLLDFLDEMRLDVKHTGNKSTRDNSLIELLKPPAIRAGSLKRSLPQKQDFYLPILMNFLIDKTYYDKGNNLEIFLTFSMKKSSL